MADTTTTWYARVQGSGTVMVPASCPHGCEQPVHVKVNVWVDGFGEFHVQVESVGHVR